MPKIISLRFRVVIAKLKKLGFVGPLYGGKHPIMKKNGVRIPVPKHGGKDVSQGVISCVIQQIGISVDEWNQL